MTESEERKFNWHPILDLTLPRSYCYCTLKIGEPVAFLALTPGVAFFVYYTSIYKHLRSWTLYFPTLLIGLLLTIDIVFSFLHVFLRWSTRDYKRSSQNFLNRVVALTFLTVDTIMGMILVYQNSEDLPADLTFLMTSLGLSSFLASLVLTYHSAGIAWYDYNTYETSVAIKETSPKPSPRSSTTSSESSDDPDEE